MNSFFMTDTSANQFSSVLERLRKDNPTLPEKVFHEKAYQCFMQNYFLGREMDGETWYMLADENTKLLPDSPVGSSQLRVDYNKRPVGADPIETIDPLDIHNQVMMALSQPYSFEHYPSNAYIECIRVTVRVAPDVDIEHVYWPSMHSIGAEVTAVLQGRFGGQDVGVCWYWSRFQYEITPEVVERLTIEALFAPHIEYDRSVFEEWEKLTQDERDSQLAEWRPIINGFIISDDKQTAVYDKDDTKLYIEIIDEKQTKLLRSEFN